jgi:hypothetical protein
MNESHVADRSASTASAPAGMTLAGVQTEFGWTCWCDGDQCYARRPQTPPGEHDARGEDPADLREAIVLALRSGHGTPTEQADLASLATELAARGYRTTLRAPTGAVPRLHITNPRATALTEQVYAQGGNYWFSWGQPIVTCDRPATAAAILARVLRAEGE